MEPLKTRIGMLSQALERLNESVNSFTAKNIQANELMLAQIRDSVIKRFEFCFDLLWKCLKDHLEQNHGIDVASPKTSFRECFSQKLINEKEFATLDLMLGDRNNTSHRYDEVMAEEIAQRAANYHHLMVDLCNRLKP
jgi:nucleotidyltransferase substrate binding protein (TIGR01987 family)